MENYMKLELAAVGENEGFARNAVAAFALCLNPSISELSDIKTAVSEAVTNCIVHAYGGKIMGSIWIECQVSMSETGGVFVREKNDLYFVCGNDFHKRSEYRIYSKKEMQTAKFNYPDGGFRGWGCVMPLKLGSRTRFFWLTFDRHNGSDYNWSYGNIYCFEAE